MRVAILCLVSVFCTLLPAVSAFAQQKVALLVGVETYERKGFSNLRFAEDDMQVLADQLRKNGFDVTLMLGSAQGANQATLANIKKVIADSFIPRIANLKKSDIALVALAGHGRHQLVTESENASEDHFFCPMDAHDTETATWLSISKLVEDLETNSGCENNLLLVDACRDNPSRGRGVDGKGFNLNKDSVAVFFSASYKQQAWEPQSLRHGLFSYYVVEALKGQAPDFQGNVTWDSLVGYVKTKVSQESAKLVGRKEIESVQQPNAISNLKGNSPILGVAAAKVIRKRPSDLTVPFTSQQASAAQAAWATYLKQPLEVTNSVGIKLRIVPPGKFTMGSSESTPAENETPHLVSLTSPFYVALHEVTVGQFEEFVDSTNYTTTAERYQDFGRGWSEEQRRFVETGRFTWKNPGWAQGKDQPVVNVSWEDASKFVHWLSRKENSHYRLLTEAEWEYCCRGGAQSSYCFGDDPKGLVKYGNVLDRTGWQYLATDSNFARANQTEIIQGTDGGVFTTKVGSFKPNALGLYDFHGNVCEWCGDWYDDDYSRSSKLDPKGAPFGELRSARGGRFDTGKHLAKVYTRNHGVPLMTDMILGFRIMREIRE